MERERRGGGPSPPLFDRTTIISGVIVNGFFFLYADEYEKCINIDGCNIIGFPKDTRRLLRRRSTINPRVCTLL